MAERGAKLTGDGVLTANPEIRNAGNTPVANFSLAFNYAYGRGDDRRRETTYVDCEAWGWLADFFNEHASKGTKVNVEGRLVQKSWEKEGRKYSKLALKIEHANIIQKTSNGNGGSQPTANSNQGGSNGQSAESTEGPPLNPQVASGENTEVREEEMPF